MNCSNYNYIPYCHPLRHSNEGVCTCEHGNVPYDVFSAIFVTSVFVCSPVGQVRIRIVY